MKNFAIGFMLSIAFVAPAQAGDPVLGKQKAQPCLACHGDHLTPAKEGVPKIDRILPEALVAAMQKMREVYHDQPLLPHNLSDTDIADIAAYFRFKGD